MSKNSQPKKTQPTETTLCFRNFLNKHSELSRIYWTHLMSSEHLRNSIVAAPPKEFTASYLNSSFPSFMHPQTIEETLSWLNTYMDRSRLHILVVCSANLEAYLKEITRLFLLSSGHRKSSTEPFTLNSIGKALGAQILEKSSLPEPLKYAQDLFSLSLKNELPLWNTAYKLRCAAAHNGGVVDEKTKRELANLNLTIGDQISLDWEDLKSYLKCAHDIAKKIDSKLQSYEIKILESEKILNEGKITKKLPNRKSIWTYLHENFSINGIRNCDKEDIEHRLYSSTT